MTDFSVQREPVPLVRLRDSVEAIRVNRQRKKRTPFRCEVVDCTHAMDRFEVSLAACRDASAWPRQLICLFPSDQWVVVHLCGNPEQPAVHIMDGANRADRLEALTASIERFLPDVIINYQPLSFRAGESRGPLSALKTAYHLAFPPQSVDRLPSLPVFLPRTIYSMGGGTAYRWGLFAWLQQEQKRREEARDDYSPILRRSHSDS